MSAVETLSKHSFGKQGDLGPPALERAAHQLMIDEANRRISAEKQIEDLKKQLASEEADCESAEKERDIANARVGELTAELAKRGEAYRGALADYDTKLMQAREARNTADVLAAQARAEADGERSKASEIGTLVRSLQEQIAALMTVERTEVPAVETQAPAYRVNVVSRDAAGDLRALELVPIERN